MTFPLKFTFILVLGFIQILPINAQTSAFTSRLSYQISSAKNDAEEKDDGNINFSSSDIELGFDGSSKQITALRFENILIPAETNITNAYLEFTTDEVKTGACDISIKGEKSTNAGPISDAPWSISTKTKTNATLIWSPGNWSSVDEIQQSPDISEILNELVAQDGWLSGNNMTFILEGSGTRTAYSYNKDPLKAAKLVIEVEYTTSQTKINTLVLNELMPKNYTVNDEFGEADDWLELYNTGSSDIFMGGLYLSDDIQNMGKWQLRAPITVAAGEFAVLWIDKDTLQGPLHANFKLSAAGETLILSQFINDQYEIIDLVSFDTIPADISYGRNQDGATSWSMMGRPTPGSSNNYNSLYFPEPEISLPSGFYSEAVSVTLTAQIPSARIYYSLDGSNPGPTSNLYTEAIAIDSTTLLKSISIHDGYAPSKEVSAFYLLDDHKSLPVFNISTKTEYLWDNSIGIYTVGTNGLQKKNFPVPANFFQDWERPARITMIGTDGLEAFSEGAGIEVGGNASRVQIQKTFNIHFRDKYGNGGIRYKLFDDRKTKKFKHIKLRNGGQDFRSTMIRDGLNHSILTNEADVDVLAYRPVVLYLNGKYWGMYGLRESFNDNYIDSYFAVKKDKLDIVRGTGPGVQLIEGSDSAFKALYQFIADNDLSSKDNYDFISDNIDINSYIDYHVSQLYYSNSDWPQNNVMIWREQKNGKWRWMLFDTDASTNYEDWGNTEADFNSIEFSTSSTSTQWPNNSRSNLFMRKLFENTQFRHEFAQRTCTYMKLIYDPSKTDALIDSVLFLIDLEIDQHIEKWTQEYDFGRTVTCDTTRFNWEQNVANYRQFFHDRPDKVVRHYQQYFNIDSTYDLHFNYDSDSKGKLYLHHNMMPMPHEYAGNYFNDYALPITAVPNSGYRFVEWKETGDTSSQISFISDKSSILTPVFAETKNPTRISRESAKTYFKAFPNPAKNQNVEILVSDLLPDQEYTIGVFTVDGLLISEYPFVAIPGLNSRTIQTTNLTAGFYLVCLRGHQQSSTLKLIIQD